MAFSQSAMASPYFPTSECAAALHIRAQGKNHYVKDKHVEFLQTQDVVCLGNSN